MTISNITSSVRVQGDGLTTTFSYDFYMVSSANALLVFEDASGGEAAISNSAFSITGVTSSTGGTFTYPLSGAPITAGEALILYRILGETQDAAIGNQGNFYPSVVEGALDKLTMLVQQLTPEGDYGVPFIAGNPTTIPGVFRQLALGSGLSVSGNSVVVSGISGSGTVTQINTGTGIAGGPITGVGTLSLSTISSGFLLANFSGGVAAPVPVQLVAGSGITFSGATSSLTLTTTQVGNINFIIDGGGSTITTGVWGDIGPYDFAMTLGSYTALANQTGSISVSLWMDTYANYPPTSGDTINGTNYIAITSSLKSQDTTLSSWTTSIPSGRTLRVNVESVTSIQRVGICLKYTR